MKENLVSAPYPSFRLIPSQYPPIGLFDTVATTADLAAVMELAGWTNDRLVAQRIARLPQSEWVYGRPNASVIMAAFLHVAPTGMRFNRAELGAWYAAANLATAAAEVGHHLRREAFARRLPESRRKYRAYVARIEGDHVDIRGDVVERRDILDPASHVTSQAFGESVRASGLDGIVYGSVRLRGGVNVVSYRPSKIMDVIQADHFEISVHADRKAIEVRKLAP